MLTSEQKKHFEVFGFLALRGLFSEKEMAIITQEAQEIFPRGEEWPTVCRN